MDSLPKTFVVTGATSGIGLALARQLVAQGSNVIGIGRSAERCWHAQQVLSKINPHVHLTYLLADLSLLVQVRQLAQQIKQQLTSWYVAYLDGLVNNAAILPFHQTTTVEGFDTQWAVNYLSGFLLTNLLLPPMHAAPAARIISVSSASHYHTYLHWHDLQLFHSYNPLRAYKHTKLAQVLFIHELNRRLHDHPNIKAFAADPGLVNTDIGLKGNSLFMDWIWKLRRRGGVSPGEAARGIAFLLLDPDLQNSNQIYWRDSRPQSPNPRALNLRDGERLWDISSRMMKLIS